MVHLHHIPAVENRKLRLSISNFGSISWENQPKKQVRFWLCFVLGRFGLFVGGGGAIDKFCMRIFKDSLGSFRHQCNFKPHIIPFSWLLGASLFHLLCSIYVYNLLITSVSKASNKNQKQAASWFLPFITQQQRTAVNNIIGIYLFLPSDPKPDIPQYTHWSPGWLFHSSSPISFTTTACNEIHCCPASTTSQLPHPQVRSPLMFLQWETSFSLSVLDASYQNCKASHVSTRSSKSCWEAQTSQLLNRTK